MAAKFQIQQTSGLLHYVDCPDPMQADWEYMEPVQVTLTGRAVQQGKLRCTLHWEYMSDDEFGNLMDEWKDAMSSGFRLTSIMIPTLFGHDNATYELFTTNPSGRIRMMLPKATRLVLYAKDVSVIFEDIIENA